MKPLALLLLPLLALAAAVRAEDPATNAPAIRADSAENESPISLDSVEEIR